MSLIRLRDVSRDHPRLRGEYLKRLLNTDDYLGSPPLARGVRIERVMKEAPTWITPACAGSTLKKA